MDMKAKFLPLILWASLVHLVFHVHSVQFFAANRVVPSSDKNLEEREIGRLQNSSRIQCTLRCRRNEKCTDALYLQDGICLLLKGADENGHNTKEGAIEPTEVDGESVLIQPINVPGTPTQLQF